MHPGPRQQDAFNVAQGDATSDVFGALLGPPKRRMEFDPRHNLAQELFSKTELFEGRLRYLGTFFRGMLFESHNPFVLRRLLPPRRRDDVNFVYQYYEFPRIPAIATAAQAPAHRVTAIRKSSTATMERYSLAVEDSAMSQRTTEGQMLLAGKILSMAMGFIEMMEINGFRALLEQPAYYRRYWLEAQLHAFDFDSRVDIETWQFDALHKNKNGFASLLNAVRQDMAQSADFIVNYVIIPEGARGLISAQPELQEYNIRGEGNQQFADAMADAPALRTSYPGTGIEWAVARGIEFDGADLYYSPLQRRIMIGSHYRMDYFGKKCPPDQWCSEMMATGIFSMDDDNIVKITVADALMACERFDGSYEGNLSEVHQDLAEHAVEVMNENNLPANNNQVDMFLYHTVGDDGAVTFNVAQFWAQMEEWALSHDVTKRIAMSMAYYFTKHVGDAGIAAINDGINAMAEVWNAPVGNNDEPFLLLASDPPEEGKVVGKGSIGGGPSVPPVAPDAADMFGTNYMPRGFGTTAGFIALADDAGPGGADFAYLNRTIVDKAVAFKDAWSRFTDAAIELLTDKHPLLDPAYAPVAYTAEGTGEMADKYRRMVTLGANLIDGNKLPLLRFVDGERPPRVALPAPFETMGAPAGSLRVFAEFASVEALNKFKRDFAASAFGRLYLAYANAKAGAAGGAAGAAGGGAAPTATARRTRRAVATVELTSGGGGGEEEEEELEVGAIGPIGGGGGGGGAPAADLLTRFHNEEVVPRAVSAAQLERFAIYQHVVRLVRTKQAPNRVNKELLDSWSGDIAAFEGAGGAIGTFDRERRSYLTRLSVPLERIKGRKGFGVMSPISSMTTLNATAASDLADYRAANSRVDLDATTVFAQTHPARYGYRGPTSSSAASELAFGEDTPYQYDALFSTDRAPITAAGDVFYDTIVDDGRGKLKKNAVAVHRYTRAGRESNWLLRIAEQLFLLAPINRKVLLNFDERDIPQPWACLLEMPFQGYISKAIIFVSLSTLDPLGETAFQDPDTHFARDANRKTFYIHTSVETASIVIDTRRYQVVPDAIVDGYVCGCNTRPILAAEFDAANVLKMDESSPGMFYFMVPAGSLVGRANSVPRKHDIRGIYNPTIYKYRNDGSSASMSKSRPHFGSAAFYNKLFNFADLRVLSPSEQLIFSQIEEYANSVTLQGLQVLYLGRGDEYTKIIKPCDHFGEAVFPGCAKLRRNGAIAEVYPREYYHGMYYAE